MHVTAITTMAFPPPADLTGADDYMTGLIQFARAVVPGSARIIASTGDNRNALIMLTVQADFGAGTVTLPRLPALPPRREQQDQVRARRLLRGP